MSTVEVSANTGLHIVADPSVNLIDFHYQTERVFDDTQGFSDSVTFVSGAFTVPNSSMTQQGPLTDWGYYDLPQSGDGVTFFIDTDGSRYLSYQGNGVETRISLDLLGEDFYLRVRETSQVTRYYVDPSYEGHDAYRESHYTLQTTGYRGNELGNTGAATLATVNYYSALQGGNIYGGALDDTVDLMVGPNQETGYAGFSTTYDLGAGSDGYYIALEWSDQAAEQARVEITISDAGGADDVFYVERYQPKTADTSMRFHWDHNADGSVDLIAEDAGYKIIFAEQGSNADRVIESFGLTASMLKGLIPDASAVDMLDAAELAQLISDHATTQKADTFKGSQFDEVINGENGSDVLDGNAGNDTINGGNGKDKIFGGDGDDVLTVRHGDLLSGGAGADIFVFDRNSGRGNNITDFDQEVDLIRIGKASADFDDLQLVSFGNGTKVIYGSADIFISGVTPSELSDADFMFA